MSALRFDAVTLPGPSRPRLKEFSLELGAGECTFLLGPNGAGKSTLLRTALALEHPSQGRVFVDELDVQRLRPRERARRMAWLPQQARYEQALTAVEVVAIARYRFSESKEQALARAQHWLGEVGAGELGQRRVTELSGGEQQRVKLGALLAQEAPLLLLDEPANHLDPAQQVDVYQVLARRWQAGQSVLCVTHDINLVAVVGEAHKLRLVGVKAGTLAFDTHFDDGSLCEKLEDLYGVAFERYASAESGALRFGVRLASPTNPEQA